MAATTTTTSQRYHALDGLRGFALLLGVFYHAAESFSAGHWNWAIVDRYPSETLEFFRHISHCFRMEVFFLLAGFFARLVIARRGLKAFARNRFGRIVIPLVVGWLILFPCLIFIWLAGAVKAGNFRFLDIPQEFRTLPVWKLWIGFMLEGGIIDKFSLAHLWFLHQLLAIYGLFLLLRATLGRTAWTPRLLAWSDARFTRLAESRGRVFWLALPTLGCLQLMNSSTVDTPMNSLIPHLPTTLLYGLCFIVGWWLHRKPPLISRFGRGWPGLFVIAAVALIPTWWSMAGLLRSLGLPVTDPPAFWHRLLYQSFYAVAMWALILGSLGLFTTRIRAKSRFWRYVAESSYWVYLAHLPLVVSLQVWVAFWDIHWAPKYLFILLVALPLLYLSYHYLVRSSFIGRQLNGRTWPFTPLPPWLARGKQSPG